MRMDVHLHVDLDPAVLDQISAISRKLDLVLIGEQIIMSQETDALDQAEAAAKANSDAEDSAEALLVSISKMVADLQANATDPATTARITALATALNARATQLSAAVVANTPAAPAPTP